MIRHTKVLHFLYAFIESRAKSDTISVALSKNATIFVVFSEQHIKNTTFSVSLFNTTVIKWYNFCIFSACASLECYIFCIFFALKHTKWYILCIFLALQPQKRYNNCSKIIAKTESDTRNVLLNTEFQQKYTEIVLL